MQQSTYSCKPQPNDSTSTVATPPLMTDFTARPSTLQRTAQSRKRLSPTMRYLSCRHRCSQTRPTIPKYKITRTHGFSQPLAPPLPPPLPPPHAHHHHHHHHHHPTSNAGAKEEQAHCPALSGLTPWMTRAMLGSPTTPSASNIDASWDSGTTAQEPTANSNHSTNAAKMSPPAVRAKAVARTTVGAILDFGGCSRWVCSFFIGLYAHRHHHARQHTPCDWLYLKTRALSGPLETHTHPSSVNKTPSTTAQVQCLRTSSTREHAFTNFLAWLKTEAIRVHLCARKGSHS